MKAFVPLDGSRARPLRIVDDDDDVNVKLHCTSAKVDKQCTVTSDGIYL